jgi:Niemann-Pick C1 protein
VQLGCRAGCLQQAEDGHCIWYGQCFTDEKGKIKNCYRTIEAPVLQDPVGLQILNKRCPHLHVDDGEPNFVCVYACVYVMYVYIYACM